MQHEQMDQPDRSAGLGHENWEMMNMRRSFNIHQTAQAWPAEPLMIVSSDGHVTARPEDYEQYLDPQYRHLMPEYISDINERNKHMAAFGYPFTPDVLEVIDDRRVIETGGECGAFDPHRRLRECEAEGVVAEVLLPGTDLGNAPFCTNQDRVRPPELRAAGGRAYNRWLTDFCSVDPKRLLGVAYVYPYPDWASVAEDCRIAKEAGFVGIHPPSQTGTEAALPPVYDPYWDPMWAACQDYDLTVNIHAGFGSAEGAVEGAVEKAKEDAQKAAAENSMMMGMASVDKFDPTIDYQDSVRQQTFESGPQRRILWQMMWGGVLDRFPKLKVAITEIHGDWAPATLEYLDEQYEKGKTPLKMPPSEYFKRNFAIGASLMRHTDVEARHKLGLDKLMFGTDYPHMEGSWPNTLAWIQCVLGNVPENEARMILGENSINFFGLDREYLKAAALRYGPFPADVFGQTPDPILVRHLHFRGGLDKHVSYESREKLMEFFDEDVRGALAAV